MKKINILYWIFTGLLILLMLSSAIPSLLNDPRSVKFMADLGYPSYFGFYLGVWKILGVIALLVPGFPKVKEWAYAGFAFDLVSALYSFIAHKNPVSDWTLFPVFFAILIGSYYYNQKRMSASGLRESAV